MKTKPKFTSDSMAMRHAFARLRTLGRTPRTWINGEVATPYGFVSVYAQSPDDGRNVYTRFDFIHKATLYMRYFKRTFSERGTTTKARQFAKEITSGY